MRELEITPEGFLDPIANVVEAALAQADELRPDNVMVVGAWCRDVWHRALGHTFSTAMTRDIDLALALSSWDVYRALAGAFPRVNDTGIRFRIADVNVDLLPFGDIEDPQGTAKPPTRDIALSVWAFEEIKTGSTRRSRETRFSSWSRQMCDSPPLTSLGPTWRPPSGRNGGPNCSIAGPATLTC